MARPTTTLRLSDIDPAALSADITGEMARHIARLAAPLSPGLTVHVDGPHGDSGVGLSAADLARYARGEGGLDSTVEDYAVELVPLLSSPLATGSALPPVLTRWLAGQVDADDLDPDSLEDRLALVLTAALGREALDHRQPVSVGQLATLAGVSPDHVRLLGRRGEVAVEGGQVSAEEARRWLAGRGVRVRLRPHTRSEGVADLRLGPVPVLVLVQTQRGPVDPLLDTGVVLTPEFLRHDSLAGEHATRPA